MKDAAVARIGLFYFLCYGNVMQTLPGLDFSEIKNIFLPKKMVGHAMDYPRKRTAINDFRYKERF